jgi:hypothetical protein
MAVADTANARAISLGACARSQPSLYCKRTTFSCGPPRSVQITQRPLPPAEFHYKVAYKKHLRWSGRVPIPGSSSDFVAPPGTVIQDWMTMTFPEPLGEYGQEERFYCTRNSEEFERACKDSPVVLGYWPVEPDAWRKAAAPD